MRLLQLAPIVDLLCSFFGDTDSMRRVVLGLPDGERLEEHGPETRPARRAYAHDLVLYLSRERRLDTAFFDALAAARPARQSEVRAVQRGVQRLVLFLSATPPSLPSLAVGDEARGILEALRQTEAGARIGIVVRSHTTAAVWRTDVPTMRPEIIHFAGHGNVLGRLVLEAPDGGRAVPADPMLDQLVASGVSGAYFGACWSDRLAEAAVRRGVTWAIGMTDPVPDPVAIHFASGFYEGLGLGKTPREAYDWAFEVARWQGHMRPPNPKFFPR